MLESKTVNNKRNNFLFLAHGYIFCDLLNVKTPGLRRTIFPIEKHGDKIVTKFLYREGRKNTVDRSQIVTNTFAQLIVKTETGLPPHFFATIHIFTHPTSQRLKTRDDEVQDLDQDARILDHEA